MNENSAETSRLSTADEFLLRARAATDAGHRTPLDEVISAFGYNRAELEAELEADQLAGRDYNDAPAICGGGGGGCVYPENNS